MTSFKNLTRKIADIGTGSQASVSKHRVIATGEIVAIKTYISEFNIDIPVLRELNAFQKLKDCDTMAQCLGVDFNIAGQKLLVQLMMPLYKQDLNHFMTSHDTDERIIFVEPFMAQMLKALTTLYYRGIVHSDIKPENILLDEQNNLYLADFGLSIQMQ